MWRPIVSAVASRAIAQRLGGVAAGPAGLAIGLVLPAVARRLGPLGIASVAVGAWAMGRVLRAADAKLPPVEGD